MEAEETEQIKTSGRADSSKKPEITPNSIPVNRSAEYMGSGEEVKKLIPLTESADIQDVPGNSSMERLIGNSPGRGPSASVEPGATTAVLP